MLSGCHLHGELIDRQIEPHPRRDAVHGCEPKDRRTERRLVLPFQDLSLYVHFGLRVQRDRAQLGLFGHQEARIRHAAVVAAGGHEDESPDPGLPARDQERSRSIEVHGARQLRITCAGRVPDDRGEVNDAVHPGDRPPHHIGVTNVASDEVEARGRPNGEQRLPSVGE